MTVEFNATDFKFCPGCLTSNVTASRRSSTQEAEIFVYLVSISQSNSNGHYARRVLCDGRFNIRCKSTKLRARPLIKRDIVSKIALHASKSLIDSRLYLPGTKSIPKAISFNLSQLISSDVANYYARPKQNPHCKYVTQITIAFCAMHGMCSRVLTLLAAAALVPLSSLHSSLAS